MANLLTELLLLPLAPVRSVAWIGEQVRAQALSEQSEADFIRQRLAEIDEAHRAGELSDDERAEQEQEIVEELRWVTGERHDD